MDEACQVCRGLFFAAFPFFHSRFKFPSATPTSQTRLTRCNAISLFRTTFTDAKGKTRVWESAERRTRSADSDTDGVGIIAIFEKVEGAEILLQKQYRPPVGKVCIEVPAGLLDPGESVERCALRELKEETGYVGEVVPGPTAVSPLMFNGGLAISLIFQPS